MSTPSTNTHTTEIELVVLKLADRLNKQHKTLANGLTGSFLTFYLEISKISSAHNSKTAAQTMPRHSFQKLISALKEDSPASLIVDGIFHLRQYSMRPDVPSSLFHNGKAVIAEDAIIHILHAIWEHAGPVTEKAFKDTVSGTCAYVPTHIVSRYLRLVQPRRISRVVVSKAEKAAIGLSTFGYSIIGESYLRVMTPTPASPDSAGKPVTSGASPASSTSIPLDTSTTLPLPPNDESHGDQPPSLASPSSSSSKEDVSVGGAEQRSTGKRKWFEPLERVVDSFKRRKVSSGGTIRVDEEPAAMPEGSGGTGTASAAGAAQGTMSRPVRKLRSGRGCPLAPLLPRWLKTMSDDA